MRKGLRPNALLLELVAWSIERYYGESDDDAV